MWLRGAPRKRVALNAALLDRILSVHYPVHMRSITYTAARERLSDTMDEVCEERSPVIITRNRDRAVVMISLEEYQALEETAHLLRSPPNAKRLLESIHELELGDGQERELVE